jgi:hypothetical protein
MRFLIHILVVALIPLSVNAQDEPTVPEHKRMIGIGIYSMPLSFQFDKPWHDNNGYILDFRSQLDDKKGFRAGATLNLWDSQRDEVTHLRYGSMVTVGIERVRFTSNQKFRFSYGLDVAFLFSNEEIKTFDVVTYERKDLGFGLGPVFGASWFPWKRFSLMTEIGYVGLMRMTDSTSNDDPEGINAGNAAQRGLSLSINWYW